MKRKTLIGQVVRSELALKRNPQDLTVSEKAIKLALAEIEERIKHGLTEWHLWPRPYGFDAGATFAPSNPFSEEEFKLLVSDMIAPHLERLRHQRTLARYLHQFAGGLSQEQREGLIRSFGLGESVRAIQMEDLQSFYKLNKGGPSSATQ